MYESTCPSFPENTAKWPSKKVERFVDLININILYVNINSDAKGYAL